jgi:LCP family protein required for cell wall assembly
MASRGRRRAGLPVRIARALCAVLSLLVLTGAGYGWFAYRTLNGSIDQVAGVDTSDTPGTAQNILLIGDDHRPDNASPEVLAQLSTEEDGGSTNTDTMMLLHIPAGGGQATVISLPRDSWVDIPGVGMAKLNSAFSYGAAGGGGDAGGINLLIRTIKDLTGLTIDHFARVSLLGFYQIAEALGPIQVCLNNAVNDPDSGTVLPAGVSTLDAKQALSFVRQRHGLPRGDLDREVRQQFFLSAELRKVQSTGVLLNPVKLREVLTAVGSAVQTDSGLNLLDFAEQFARLASGDVRFTTVPVLGTPTITDDNGNRVSIVDLDLAALPAFITQIVGEPAEYTAATAAQPSAVSVTVVNGTGHPGLAAAQAQALQNLGFTAEVDRTPDDTTVTTVTYPTGLEAQAKAVAAAVPGALAVPSSTVQGVTLTLGTDGHRVASAGAPADGTTSAAAPSTAAPSSPASGGDTTKFSDTSCIN